MPRPASKKPRRKVALTKRGEQSLLAHAKTFQPVFRGTKTWSDTLEQRAPKRFAELVAIAHDFNAGGEMRDRFITASSFHRFFVEQFGNVCRFQAFKRWLDAIGTGGES
jgi:hypothetical protein